MALAMSSAAFSAGGKSSQLVFFVEILLGVLHVFNAVFDLLSHRNLHLRAGRRRGGGAACRRFRPYPRQADFGSVGPPPAYLCFRRALASPGLDEPPDFASPLPSFWPLLSLPLLPSLGLPSPRLATLRLARLAVARLAFFAAPGLPRLALPGLASLPCLRPAWRRPVLSFARLAVAWLAVFRLAPLPSPGLPSFASPSLPSPGLASLASPPLPSPGSCLLSARWPRFAGLLARLRSRRPWLRPVCRPCFRPAWLPSPRPWGLACRFSPRLCLGSDTRLASDLASPFLKSAFLAAPAFGSSTSLVSSPNLLFDIARSLAVLVVPVDLGDKAFLLAADFFELLQQRAGSLRFSCDSP